MAVKLDRLLPILDWRQRITPDNLRADLMASVTNAAVALPQGVAFAIIAGLPPEFGLYASMVTAFVAAFFGSSMVMISGPTTALSAILFALLHDMAPPGTAVYVEFALLVTLLVGVFQLAAGFARLGSLVAFVSHSVITGFTAAAALLIAVSQIGVALGLQLEGGGTVFERLWRVFGALDGIEPVAALISGTTLLLVAVLQTRFRKLPGFLIALVAGSLLGYALDAGGRGIELIGTLPAVFPQFHLPEVTAGDIRLLAPGAAAIALVGLLEAISIGRSFALRRGERFDANQEILGQGLSNLVGGFFQCYAGSGSFTKSGVNAEAGARTPLATMFSCVILALILLLVAPLVAWIPTPAIAGLILYVAWRLIDIAEFRRVFRTSPPETLILMLTLAAGLLVKLDFSIYVGVIASFAVFIYKSSRPLLRVTAPTTGRGERRRFRNAELHNLVECPQILVIRLDGPLFFGSVEYIEHQFRLLERERPGQKHILFYLKGIGRLDLSGADFLRHEIRAARARGGSFRIALAMPLLDQLRRYHVVEELGEGNVYISKAEALEDAIAELDFEICAGCTKRIWQECSRLPGAELIATDADTNAGDEENASDAAPR
ncbi:sulfate transporter [Marinobacterium nitratireducens]|uniref:Sulfate transporter n=1 Tax=Marinobacterium nitratireducens TaxID=518897 RepID=A0A917ZAM8_9GAMM|nr:SulP family inorganic anion transporter [Marinobacterium nitratireducens]GGO79004.1 sulfate transporter [Marinobacterium nitratireducens]